MNITAYSANGGLFQIGRTVTYSNMTVLRRMEDMHLADTVFIDGKMFLVTQVENKFALASNASTLCALNFDTDARHCWVAVALWPKEVEEKPHAL